MLACARLHLDLESNRVALCRQLLQQPSPAPSQDLQPPPRGGREVLRALDVGREGEGVEGQHGADKLLDLHTGDEHMRLMRHLNHKQLKSDAGCMSDGAGLRQRSALHVDWDE